MACLVNRTNLVHSFSHYVYCFPLHVSGNYVPIIRRKLPYLCDTWYLSLYIDDCLVCRAGPACQTAIYIYFCFSLHVSANYVPIIRRKLPYLCDTWYLSLYIDDSLVCRAGPAYQTAIYIYLLLFSTCFGQLCAHHQEKTPYLCDTWYLSLYIDDCLVCRAE